MIMVYSFCHIIDAFFLFLYLNDENDSNINVNFLFYVFIQSYEINNA